LVAFSALYNPARISLIPDVVERDQLLSANALEESVFGIVMAAGSLVGGVFAAYWGTDAAFVCNSLSFLLSAALILRISLPPRSSGVRREADK
ncbi:MFS transporter, partial [Anoxybacillus sp. LAT_38]|nr:MFS transporter [Anoxybacillus sp. LAT_38]